MEPRTEERESRFRFDELEARIAPCALGGILTLTEASAVATATVDPAVVVLVSDNITNAFVNSCL